MHVSLAELYTYTDVRTVHVHAIIQILKDLIIC